ncbi:MAG: hypothetical protein LBR53_10685 [Deltaproteobacteria bacterium]|jgi:hypothetical protein|nr:hypothetical protein [Deltaproteobacteria bacterium]
MLLSSAIDSFLKKRKETEAEDLFWSYRNSLKSFQDFIDLDVDVAEIDSYDVACHLDKLFQEGRDLDITSLELGCIRDFINWAYVEASLDRKFGLMILKERDSVHPFFSLINSAIKNKSGFGNLMYWAIFLWNSNKSGEAPKEEELRQSGAYSFMAVVDDNGGEDADLIAMDNYYYYGGPVAGLVSLINDKRQGVELDIADISALIRKFNENRAGVPEALRTLNSKKYLKYIPSNLKNKKLFPPSPRAAKDASVQNPKDGGLMELNSGEGGPGSLKDEKTENPPAEPKKSSKPENMKTDAKKKPGPKN